MKTDIKKIILALLLVASSTLCFAQCDKTATLTSSLTTYLNDKGEVERTKDESAVITINKAEVTIVTGDNGRTLKGAVKTYACNWATPFKEGKTVLTTALTDGGQEMHATITIEGKAGKVTLTFEAEEEPGKKIVVIADKFE
ncbi:hypothetical protein FFF34_017835 [Inquilinus sp. KBS0705]|nr:hypothetical protein FFF34_017835 [Inquilinus sp. KBS0705]